jgi:hypothetical protein
MEKERNVVQQEESSENGSKNDEEDLLYTHKPQSQGNNMQWNPSLFKRPGH